MSSSRGIYHTFRREISYIAHDRNILMVLAIAPMFYLFFYGSIYLHKAERDVPVVVVDLDHSELSRTLIRYIDAHSTVAVKGTEADFEAAKEQLYRMNAFGIVLIPAEFSSSLKRGKGAVLPVYLNVSRFMVGNDINRAINEVAMTMDAGARIKGLETKGLSPAQAMNAYEPIRADIRPLFNPADNYGDFLLPGLLALILQQTLLFAVAEGVAKERERGTVWEWIAAAGGSVFKAIAGKGLAFIGISSALACFVFAVVEPIYKLPTPAHSSALILLAVLQYVAIISMGMLLGSFFTEKRHAMQIAVFTTYPLFLASGFSWPYANMPGWLQGVFFLFPSTPFLMAEVRVSVMEAGIGDIARELIHLVILAVVYLGMAWWQVNRLKKIATAIPTVLPTEPDV